MLIRTILAAVSGGTASHGATELACRLARRFDSHLEALHVRPDPRAMAVAALGGFPMLLTDDFLEQATRDVASNAAKAHEIFDAAVRRHALPLQDAPPPLGTDPALLHRASACWREEAGGAATIIADRARLFDLLILGRSGRMVGEPYGDAVEATLLASGRPALIAPAQPPKVLGDAVAVAWNDTPQSAHALAAAMPFICRARAVHVLSIGETHASELVKHLLWHGVQAIAQPVHAGERASVGASLLAAARNCQADLLVMGGYGRRPWREALLGGATHEVVGGSHLPLLIAH